MRLMMLFALATLAVIGVIAVLFIGNFRQSQRDSIVLPDAAQSAQPAAQQPGEEPSLLEVSRSNVQSIVRYLHRPQYYHQSYTITRQMGGAASESTAELWVSDTRVCAVLTSAAGEKHLLTDGQTLYVWYASDEKVRPDPHRLLRNREALQARGPRRPSYHSGGKPQASCVVRRREPGHDSSGGCRGG